MAKKKVEQREDARQVIPADMLYNELSLLIEKNKQKVVSHAKSTINLLFWQVGKRINDKILHNKRAEYGAQIIPALAERLSATYATYSRNFELRNLRRMMQFADEFPDKKIVSTLSTQLSWSHIIELLPLQTMDAKLFYANEAIVQGQGIRELRKAIATKTFERKQIANTQVSKNSKIPMNTFKDPYMFDFFGIQNLYLEKDVEEAILHDLENFILELGKGFAFAGRQYRIILDNTVGMSSHFELKVLMFSMRPQKSYRPGERGIKPRRAVKRTMSGDGRGA
jgi:predicted nuclease of restriction endonuclease-like (RecB) superfamily